MNIEKLSETLKVGSGKQKNALGLYDKRIGEPESSVVESLDYDFAISRYGRDDFRYAFIEAYISYIKDKCNKVIYNCKFEHRNNDAEFLNFYIYMETPDPDVRYRIDDPKHEFIVAFNEVLKRCSLQGITSNTRVQLILKYISKIRKAMAVAKAWQDVHDQIKELFPECVLITSFGIYFYVFINSDEYEKLKKNRIRLEEIKKYCYQEVKKYDKDNAWKYEEYHIYIDDCKVYQEIGGRNYFNSDAMHEGIYI